MKFKTNYFSLLLIVFLFAGGITMAQTPANGTTGVSTTTSISFPATGLAGEVLEICDYPTITSNNDVALVTLGAAGTTTCTFSAIQATFRNDLASASAFANNTSYYWVIWNSGQHIVEYGNIGSPFSFTTIPGTPTATAATPIGLTSFTATWTAPTNGAPDYYLTVGSTSGAHDILNQQQVAGTNSSYPISGLNPNSTYYYSVQAGDGLGHNSGASNIEPVITLPTPPTAAAATSITTTGFTANWSSVSGASSYTLIVAGGPTITGIVGTSQAVTGLTINTTYSYTVEVVVGSDTSAPSSPPISVTTSPPPSSVSLTGPIDGITGVSVLPTFNWTNDFSGNSGFQIQISRGGFTTGGFSDSVFTTITDDIPSATSFSTLATIAGLPLMNDTLYYWQVTVLGGPSGGVKSAIYHFTTTQIFSVGLSTPAESDNLWLITPVHFSWFMSGAISTNGLQFIVEYTDTTIAPTSESLWSGPDFHELTTTTGLSNSANLLPGKTYYWRVLVQRISDGDYMYYPQATVYGTFTTAGGATDTTIVYPSWPVGNSTVYTNSPQLNWYLNQYSGGLTFQVNYSSTSGAHDGNDSLDAGATSIPTNANISSATPNFYEILPSLTPGTTYYWQVRAYYSSTGVYSPWSAIDTFYTNGPGTPVVPVVSFPSGGNTIYTTSPTFYWYLNSPSSGLLYDIDLATDTLFTPSGSEVSGYPITTFMQDVLNYLITNLIPGQTYYWRVRADGSTHSAWSQPDSNSKFTVAGGVPASYPVASWPTGTPPPVLFTTMPIVNWYLEGSNLGIDYYIIKYQESTAPTSWSAFAPSPNTTLGGIYTVSPSTFSEQIGHELTYGLTYGATYYWAVAGHENASDSSSPYSQGSFSIVGGSAGALLVLKQPSDSATVYSTTDTLKWYLNGPAVGIISYTVRYSQSDQYTPLVDSITGILNQYQVVSGLVDGATYYWSVGAVYSDSTIWSPWNFFTVNTGSPSLTQPFIGSPNKVQVNTLSPELSWALPAPSVAGTTYNVMLSTNSNFSNPQTYSSAKSFIQLSGLNIGNTYYWKVRSKNSAGATSYYSGAGQFKTGTSITAVANNKSSAIPKEFAISQNYPNPFNPSTIINYALPKSSLVTLKIYNILGQEVKTLLNTQSPAGSYSVQWNGENNFGQHVASGIYIYRIVAGQYIKSMKMVLLK
jgi:hypothetical protein